MFPSSIVDAAPSLPLPDMNLLPLHPCILVVFAIYFPLLCLSIHASHCPGKKCRIKLHLTSIVYAICFVCAVLEQPPRSDQLAVPDKRISCLNELLQAYIPRHPAQQYASCSSCLCEFGSVLSWLLIQFWDDPQNDL